MSPRLPLEEGGLGRERARRASARGPSRRRAVLPSRISGGPFGTRAWPSDPSRLAEELGLVEAEAALLEELGEEIVRERARRRDAFHLEDDGAGLEGADGDEQATIRQRDPRG